MMKLYTMVLVDGGNAGDQYQAAQDALGQIFVRFAEGHDFGIVARAYLDEEVTAMAVWAIV